MERISPLPLEDSETREILLMYNLYNNKVDDPKQA